ncbi:MAG: UvrB/UvrC motif-containing protein [Chthoniobacterales bacterium]|jgi:protein arginine kinase activator
MFCDVCKTKEATVFLTQIVEGKMQKVNLCEGCSREKGVNDPTGFALADLLLGLGAAQEIEKNPAGARCPVCGFSQADFKKTGRLGCSACYDAFAEGLSGMLRNMHRGIIHTGKVPARLEEARRRNREFAALQASLEKAVASEQFEEAATIRDSIRLLESDTAKGSEDGAAPVTRPAPHPEPAVIKEKPPSKPRKKQ